MPKFKINQLVKFNLTNDKHDFSKLVGYVKKVTNRGNRLIYSVLVLNVNPYLKQYGESPHVMYEFLEHELRAKN